MAICVNSHSFSSTTDLALIQSGRSLSAVSRVGHATEIAFAGDADALTLQGYHSVVLVDYPTRELNLVQVDTLTLVGGKPPLQTLRLYSPSDPQKVLRELTQKCPTLRTLELFLMHDDPRAAVVEPRVTPPALDRYTVHAMGSASYFMLDAKRVGGETWDLLLMRSAEVEMQLSFQTADLLTALCEFASAVELA